MGSLSQASNSATPGNNYQAPQTIIPSGDPNLDPTNPFALGKTQPDTIGDQAAIALRAALKGVASIPDMVLGSIADSGNAATTKSAETVGILKHLGYSDADINNYFNTVDKSNIPASPTQALVEAGANSLGMSKPVTKSEQLLDNTVSNAAAFAVPLDGEAKIGNTLINAGAGATSGLAQGLARQAGAGTGTQTGVGLLVGASGLILGHGFAGRFGEPVANVVKSTPVTDVFDKDGNLTEQGQDVVAQAHTDPNTLRQAYEEASANTQVHYDAVKQTRDEAIQAGLPEDHPTIQAANALLDQVDQIRSHVDQVLNPTEQYETPSVNDNRTPEQKVQDAQQLGNEFIGEPVNLTTGQATNDANILSKEFQLTKPGNPLSDAAQNIKQTQQNQVNEIADQISTSLNDPSLSKTDRGSMIQNAIQQLKQQSYARVKAVWAKLANMENAPNIDTTPIFDAAYDAMDKYGTGDSRKNDLLTILGKYQAIPNELIEQQTYDPIFKQTRIALKNGKALEFNGESQPLTIANAENMNADLNSLYDKNVTNNPHLAVKSTLMDARDAALDQAATKGNNLGALGQEARSAYQEHMNTFGGKNNIIAKLVEKDTNGNYKLNPDKVIDMILGTKDNIKDLKSLKAILLSNLLTKDIWNVIKGQAISNIISNAMKGPNLSASVLERQLKTMGTDKLHTLFDAHEFNNIMKLNRLAKDINATGAGLSAPLHNHLINMLYHAARYSSLFLGHGASHVAAFATMGLSDLGRQAKIAREADETLAAMKEYQGKPEPSKLSLPELSPERLKQFSDFLASKEFNQPLLQGALSKKDNN